MLWMLLKVKIKKEKNLLKRIKKPKLIITQKSKKNEFKRITSNDQGRT